MTVESWVEYKHTDFIDILRHKTHELAVTSFSVFFRLSIGVQQHFVLVMRLENFFYFTECEGQSLIWTWILINKNFPQKEP